jgi:hypothetical protein
VAMASPATEELWTERVRAWRESGQRPEDLARGKDFTASTLRWWTSRIGRSQPRFLQLVPTGSAAPHKRELVVEVGTARIVIEQGFDPALLAAVVGALGSSR